MNEKQSILIVDDDQEFRKMMKKALEKSGYNVAIARDGREAIDSLSVGAFDLVISELRVSKLTGIELMEEINRKRIDVSVIFLTAYGEVESYMDLMNMGAFDYVNKPVKGQEILTVVRQALETNSDACHSSRS